MWAELLLLVLVTFMHSQAERTTIALQRNHPELQAVWLNLKINTAKGNPEKATQPTNLRVKLLPFQLEGLCWMRKQEKGVWRGGVLAVRILLLLIFGV
jgi:DNA repair protein RAD16